VVVVRRAARRREFIMVTQCSGHVDVGEWQERRGIQKDSRQARYGDLD